MRNAEQSQGVDHIRKHVRVQPVNDSCQFIGERAEAADNANVGNAQPNEFLREDLAGLVGDDTECDDASLLGSRREINRLFDDLLEVCAELALRIAAQLLLI
ncbi:MAG: hypothetical protein R3E92_21010 [Burkholderiaceae bacterium]